MPFADDVTKFYADYAITDDQLNVFVAEQNGKLIGYLVGNLEHYLFCRGLSASQEVIYVLPEYRKTRASFLLLQHFTSWAEDNGVLETYVGIANGIDMERKKKFFERKGFEVVGYYLRKI
jgi:L-amino acid N-acyltransferase YncA